MSTKKKKNAEGSKQEEFIWGPKNSNLGDTDLGKTERVFWGREIVRDLQKAKAMRLYADTRKEIFVLKGWLSWVVLG